jgi:hypothetical protein
MKSTKTFLEKKRGNGRICKSNKREEFDQSTLYEHVNIQWTPLFVQLRYTKKNGARCRWLMPVILATQEAKIRRIEIQGQPGQTATPNTKKQSWRSGLSGTAPA